ncbi:hypothetical protein KRX57_04740 [Weeksellaceae bacterium TAE3-ERU29]|nr:hypothetical protein [Weeksellaceae bacterium TAE3-ERU29]
MDTKLTLKLDKSIIEKAKKYASEKEISLSKMVENYFQSLTNEQVNNDLEISPFIKSISSGKKLPLDLDYKKEYSNYLTEKYK